MNPKLPDHWTIDPQTRCLRVQPNPRKSVLLPYENFIYSEWESDAGEKLMLHFATHAVVIAGRGLRRIEHAVQRKELSWISTFPRHLLRAIPETDPAIESIEIEKVEATSDVDESLQVDPSLQCSNGS